MLTASRVFMVAVVSMFILLSSRPGYHLWYWKPYAPLPLSPLVNRGFIAEATFFSGGRATFGEDFCVLDAFIVKDCIVLLGPVATALERLVPEPSTLFVYIQTRQQHLGWLPANRTFDVDRTPESMFAAHACHSSLSSVDRADISISYELNKSYTVVKNRSVARVAKDSLGDCSIALGTVLSASQLHILPAWLKFLSETHGICHFYLYCLGNFSQMISADRYVSAQLQVFIERDMLTFVHWDFPKKTQSKAFHIAQIVAQQSIYQRNAYAHERILFMDLDEYLVLHDDIKSILSSLSLNGEWLSVGSRWATVNWSTGLVAPQRLNSDWFYADPPLQINSDIDLKFFRGKQIVSPPKHPSAAHLVRIHQSFGVTLVNVPRELGYFLHFANLHGTRSEDRIRSSLTGQKLTTKILRPIQSVSQASP